MYTIKRGNVERVVSDETTLKNMLSQGFKLLKTEKPKENAQSSGEEDKEFDIDLTKMSIEELKAYAEEENIDLGKSTSQSGIIEKIKSALCE